MIIQGTSPAPTLKSMFDTVLSTVQQSQTQQASTIVNLSTQGQSLSRAAALSAPASSAAISSPAPSVATSTPGPAQMHDETNESSGQEINETANIRFAEGEKSGQTAGGEVTATGQEAGAQLAQYMTGAVQNTRTVSIFA